MIGSWTDRFRPSRRGGGGGGGEGLSAPSLPRPRLLSRDLSPCERWPARSVRSSRPLRLSPLPRLSRPGCPEASAIGGGGGGGGPVGAFAAATWPRSWSGVATPICTLSRSPLRLFHASICQVYQVGPMECKRRNRGAWRVHRDVSVSLSVMIWFNNCARRRGMISHWPPKRTTYYCFHNESHFSWSIISVQVDDLSPSLADPCTDICTRLWQDRRPVISTSAKSVWCVERGSCCKIQR